MSATLVILYGVIAVGVGAWVIVVNARDWKKLPADQAGSLWLPFVRLPEPARTVQRRNMNRMFAAGLGLTALFLLLAFISASID